MEGGHDRTFVQFLATDFRRDTEPLSIDEASIVSNAGGLGSRELVEDIYAEAYPGCQDRIAALVDREFRGFNCRPQLGDTVSCHHSDRTLFWTRGHSVENYGFSVDAAWAFLRTRHPGAASPELRRALVREFGPILRGATAVSLAMQEARLLSRSAGLSSLRFWVRGADGELAISLTWLTDALRQRGMTDVSEQTLRATFASTMLALSAENGIEICRWLTHGTLGCQVLWSGLGLLAVETGCKRSIAEQIACGDLDLKFNFGILEWLSQVASDDDAGGRAEAPRELIAWLSR